MITLPGIWRQIHTISRAGLVTRAEGRIELEITEMCDIILTNYNTIIPSPDNRYRVVIADPIQIWLHNSALYVVKEVTTDELHLSDSGGRFVVVYRRVE